MLGRRGSGGFLASLAWRVRKAGDNDAELMRRHWEPQPDWRRRRRMAPRDSSRQDRGQLAGGEARTGLCVLGCRALEEDPAVMVARHTMQWRAAARLLGVARARLALQASPLTMHACPCRGKDRHDAQTPR